MTMKTMNTLHKAMELHFTTNTSLQALKVCEYITEHYTVSLFCVITLVIDLLKMVINNNFDRTLRIAVSFKLIRSAH